MTFGLFRFVLAVLIVGLSGCSATSADLSGLTGGNMEETTTLDDLEPNPELSPEEVVKIQVEALKNNDDQDHGIEVTFRFASPSNKQATGPLTRFKRMVKNPAYRPMLNHKIAEYDLLEIAGDTASQRVTIIERNGGATVFLFSLSKQDTAPCRGCWMTDSVTIIPTRKQQLQDI